MSEVGRYRQFERSLWLTRLRHAGEESPEEDRLLEEMDAAWADLTDAERRRLDDEGPRCWPMDPTPTAPFSEAVPRPTVSQIWAYEGFARPEDAIQRAA